MIDKKEAIAREIEKLKKENPFIIVEGKKDRKALLELGLKNILVLNETGKSLYVKIEEFIEKIGKKECIILTDLDKKGKKLYFILKKQFLEHGIKTNGRLREMLIKARISHIEGFATFLED